MSRFKNELRVIPRAAWIAAAVSYVALACGIVLAIYGKNSNPKTAPLAVKVLLPLVVPVFLYVLVLFVGYIYGDAKRRGMPYVMWTLLAFFIPDGIGIILYFILRKPLPKVCPGCSQSVPSGFVFCPHCGTPLQATCSNCGRGVERGWSNCPHCGTKLPPQGTPTNSAVTPR